MAIDLFYFIGNNLSFINIIDKYVYSKYIE